MLRYDHLASLIAKHKPMTLCEIGVHRGARMAYMIREAMRYSPQVIYVGYDVFEIESAEFQEEVLNGKGIARRVDAEGGLRTLDSEFPQRLNWHLEVGKTQDTLHGQDLMFDFVFIDGDHRSAEIQKDYDAVKRSTCIAFDDYYMPDSKGVTPDLRKYGANSVVDAIPGSIVLPGGNECKHGGLAHIAVVTNENRVLRRT